MARCHISNQLLSRSPGKHRATRIEIRSGSLRNDAHTQAFLCLFPLVTFVLIWGNQAQIPDDAYIYLRVAATFAETGVWAFNPGDAFNATTSPLQTLILTGAIAAGLPPQIALWSTYAAALSAAGIVIFLALRHQHPFAAWAIPIAIVTWETVLRSIGLESGLLILCIVASCRAMDAGKPITAGVFCGLTTLCRPEGLALLPILLVLNALNGKGPALSGVLGFVAVIVPWTLVNYLVFDSLIQHTAEVKSLQADLSVWFTSTNWAADFLLNSPFFPIWFAILPIAAWGVLRNFRDLSMVIPGLLLFGGAQVAGYTLLNAPANYWWYFIPGGVAVIAAMGFGLSVALETVRRFTGMSALARRGLQIVLVVAAAQVLYSHVSGSAGTYGTAYRSSPDYLLASAWLRENSEETDVVAANEIGYIGYFSGRPIRDMLGLLHVEALEEIRAENWSWWLAAEPDFVIVHIPPWIGEPHQPDIPWPAEDEARFEATYAPVQEFGTVRIYRRSE